MKPIETHLREIWSGGWPALRSKVIAAVQRVSVTSVLVALVSAPLAIPAVLLIRSVRRWRLIRFGTLRAKRIGHFVPDTALRWAEMQEQARGVVDWYWLPSRTCNQQWARMVRRQLPVRPWVRALAWWNRAIPGGALHNRPSSDSASRDLRGLLARTEGSWRFSSEEDEAAKTWLRSLGWHDGEPFVCLVVRDDAYLVEDPLHRYKPSVVGYHSFRDSDIATYVPAMEWLAGQGVWVFRMGKLMRERIPTSLERIIDYAFHPARSDFLDIWLFAQCACCISTATGPDAVSHVFRRPLLFVNALPLKLLNSSTDSIWVPKHLVWKESGRALSLDEHLRHCYLRAEGYEAAGIEVLDLSEDEILAAVRERWRRYAGTWVDEPGDAERQRAFWTRLRAWPDFSRYHCWVHPDARLGADFLRRSTGFLDERE